MRVSRSVERLLAILLTVSMVFGMMPGVAFASETGVDSNYTIAVTDTAGAEVAEATINYQINVDDVPGNNTSVQTDDVGIAVVDLSAYESDLTAGKTLAISYSVEKEGYTSKSGEESISDLNGSLTVQLEKIVQETVQITVKKTGDGVVKLNGAEETTLTVNKGTEVSLEVSPAENFYIKSLMIRDVESAPEKYGNYTGTVIADADVAITVSFVTEVALDVSSNDGGTISINDSLVGGETGSRVKVDKGSTVKVDVAPLEGYQISAVTINGAGDSAERTIADVYHYSEELTANDDISISVIFVKEYKVNVTYDSVNGTVTTEPENEGGSVVVAQGTQVLISAAPKENYRVSKVTVNGIVTNEFQDNTYDSSNPFSFNIIANGDDVAEYNVEIVFALVCYDITFDASENGSVELQDTKVDHGGSTTATVTTADNYNVTQITVNETPVPFERITDRSVLVKLDSVTEDKKITVTYEEIPIMENTEDLFTINGTAIHSFETDDTSVYVYAKDAAVSVGTEKAGISLNSLSLEGTQFEQQQVEIPETITIDKVYLYENNAWSCVALEKKIKLVIDDTLDSPVLKPENPNANGYYNNNVNINVSAKDSGDFSGLASVEYWVETNGEITQECTSIYSYVEGEEILSEYTGSISVDAAANNSDDVVVYLKVTDRAGNESSTECSLKINNTAPVIDVSVSGEKHPEAEAGYYNAKRTAKVVITDRMTTFDENAATDGIIINGTPIKSSNISAPVWSSDGDTHTATIEFEEDGNYEWSITYTNKAGLTAEKGVSAEEQESTDYKFTVDTMAPEASISIDEDKWEALLSDLTFGIWKNYSVTADIQKEDATSPVKEPLYYKDKGDAVLSETELKQLFADGKFKEGLCTIPADEAAENEKFVIYARITDYAGNTIYISTDGVVYDTTRGKIDIRLSEPNENNIYIGDVKAIISVDDTAETDVVSSGIKKISYSVKSIFRNSQEAVETQSGVLYDFTEELNANKENEKFPTYEELRKTWNNENDPLIVIADKNNSEHVEVVITVEDNAGNIYEETSKVMNINMDAPEAAISLCDEVAKKGALQGYYNGVSAKVVVKDRNTSFDGDAATSGITITATDSKGEPIKLLPEQNEEFEPAYIIGEWVNETTDDGEDIHTAKVFFNTDGNYTIGFTYQNLAGKTFEVQDQSFTKDATDPSGSITVHESKWEKLLEVLTFGLYSNETVDVKATADDATSPVKIEYYKTDDPEPMSPEELDAQTFKEYKDFSIDKDEQLVIYLKITDYAGNYIYINSDGYIVDMRKSKITFTADEPSFNGKYNKNVEEINIDIAVADAVTDDQPSAGIKRIDYKVYEGTDSEKPLINLFTFEKEKPLKSDLQVTWNGSISIDPKEFNSSHVTVYVEVEDNAGNVTDNTDENNFINLDIDVTEPTIQVSYDNNNDNNGNTYFNAPRKATVVITERTDHFDAQAATDGIEITAKDAKGNDVENAYSISDWKTVEGSTPDEATHTATISFSADANYTFNAAYTDMAGNENAEITLAEGTVAPYEFTVDTKAPTGVIEMSSANTQKLTWDFQLKNLIYNIWRNDTVTVSIESQDDATSPVNAAMYYKDDGRSILDFDELEQHYERGEFQETSFTVPAGKNGIDERFVVYARLSDRAGNVAYISTNGIIYDQTKSAIEFTYDAPNDHNIYTDDVNIDVSVNDVLAENAISSGIKKIDYKIEKQVSDNGTMEETASGTLFDFDIAEPTYDQLVKSRNERITVSAKDNNSSHVVVTVTVEDNAGNEYSESSKVMDINIDQPEATVTFTDEKTKPGAQPGYYIERSAIVTVTDREDSFDAQAATEGINISATNSKNQEFTLTAGEDYVISAWEDSKSTDGKDIHTARVTFLSDGNYTIGFTYENLADKKIEVEAQDFTKDKTDPYGSITIEESIWDKLLKTITFGLYSNITIHVSATADDDTSPVKIEYYKTDDPEPMSAQELEDQSFAAYEDFSIDTDEQLVIYLKITDHAGNYIYINSDGYIVDMKQSDITLTPDQPNANGIYNKDVKVGISISDTQPSSGIKRVDYWIVKDKDSMHPTQKENLYTFDKKSPAKGDLLDKWTGSLTVDSKLNNSSDIVVYVETEDNAGNVREQTVSLDIDVTAPAIQISYDNNRDNNGNTYFDAMRTATVVITERSDHFDAGKATAGISITAKDARNTNIVNSYSISGWTTAERSTPDAATHTATIRFSADANYTFALAYTDQADNVNTAVTTAQGTAAPYKFTVDTTAPVGTIRAVSAEGRETTWNTLLSSFTFGFWSRDNIQISATQDDVTSAPIASVEYYKVTAQNASDLAAPLSQRALDAVTGWQTFSGLTIGANEQAAVYLKITDLAGNYTYISTDGLIVDDTAPVEETIAPQITINPEQPVNGIYNRNVNVDIRVTDVLSGGTYSGLKTVSYQVLNMGEQTQNGTLYSFDMQNPAQGDLLQTWTGSITVDSALNNSNDVVIEVYAEDNSLNNSRNSTAIKIDVTSPDIDVSYSNNQPENSYYFRNDRTATVTVTERNFNPDDVVVTITNTDGVIPSLSDWTQVGGSGNLDDTQWQSTILYNADGDYTFDIAYSDLAGNAATEVQYGNSVAPTQFTVDKTLPVISVSYDNDEAANQKYFKAPRTATINIVEHNFDANRVEISGTAALNGSDISRPTVSWRNSGDTHIATLSYTNDGDYTFDVKMTDVAGNENRTVDYGRSVASREFTVDQTYDNGGMTVFKDVENGKSYPDMFVPKINFNDVNYSNYEIHLYRTRKGEIDADITDEKNLQSLITEGNQSISGEFDVFQAIQNEDGTTGFDKNDDGIYRMEFSAQDKAGNTYQETVNFTINRFGSVYEYDPYLVTLIQDGGAYVTSVDEDLVITEYNANRLVGDSLLINITLDGRPINAKYSSDPVANTLVEAGTSGWFQYKYTISKDNFKEDGVYRVSLSSKDEANNTPESSPENSTGTDGKPIVDTMLFRVDGTAPEITSITGLEERIINEQEVTVQYTVYDAIGLNSVIVYVDGEAVDKINDFSGDMNNYSGSFQIKESSSEQTVRIVVEDLAGNVTDTDQFGEKDSEGNVIVPMPAYAFNDKVTVSTNFFVRWYANKLLFWGSVGGTCALAIGGASAGLFLRRKKKDEEE